MLKMETKVCSKCNINKPYSDYYLNKKCVGGVNSYCKKCHLEKKRLWRKNNPEQYKKQVKDYWGKVKLFQTEDEIYKLCHYTNLQPLWAEDNLKKSNKILVEQE
jgi:hypothetical protein